MGMAASQARLLTITARIHDVEYQAQSIQNAKIQLATQSDEVYQEYLNALDATTLTLKNANGDLITANFNNLCGKNATQTAAACKYAIMDTKNGSLVVPDDIEEAYYNFSKGKGEEEKDPYAFAMWMLGIDSNDAANFLDKLAPYEQEVIEDNKSLTAQQKSLQDLLKEAEEKFKDKNIELSCKTDLINAIGTEKDESVKKSLQEYFAKYEEIEKPYRYNLYRQYAQEIFTKAGGNELDFNQNDFNFNVPPSDHESKEFKQLHKMLKKALEKQSLIFDFFDENNEFNTLLQRFIKKLRVRHGNALKIGITTNNFF